MRTLLIDVDVVLDVLLDRQPHGRGSAAVWAAVESGRVEGLLSAHAVTTIHYLVATERGAAFARRAVAALLQVFGVATVDQAVVQRALQLAPADFEDAVTAAAAEGVKCDGIVTRDLRGFRESPVRALTPETAGALLARL